MAHEKKDAGRRDWITPIASFKETACSCAVCVQFCRTSPCMPLPAEAARLVEAGYAARLMYNAALGGVLMPARKGCEGTYYVNQRERRECTFLTPEGLCELHDKGLKPFEGRMLDHSDLSPRVSEYVLKQWRGADEAARAIASWQQARLNPVKTD